MHFAEEELDGIVENFRVKCEDGWGERRFALAKERFAPGVATFIVAGVFPYAHIIHVFLQTIVFKVFEHPCAHGIFVFRVFRVFFHVFFNHFAAASFNGFVEDFLWEHSGEFRARHFPRSHVAVSVF